MKKILSSLMITIGIAFSGNVNSSNCNDAISCFKSASSLKEKKQYKEAISDYTKSCNMGGPVGGGSCIFAGDLLFNEGKYEQAKSLYNKACYSKIDKVAVAHGCLQLGYMYYKNDSAAEASVESTALGNYYKSLNKYDKPKPDISDKSKSLELFKRGCNSQAPSKFTAEVCDMYKFVRGYTPVERKKVETLCNDKKDMLSCHRLHVTHQYGRGTPKDGNKSYIYMKKACALGHESSCQDLKQAEAISAGRVSSGTTNSDSNAGFNSGSSNQPKCRTEVYTQYLPGTQRRVQNTRYVCN